MAKYLATYAEKDAIEIADRVRKEGPTFRDAVVIPAYGEPDLSPTLDSLAQAARGPTLVILVVNGREDSPDEIHQCNESTLRRVASRNRIGELTILPIDRASRGNRFAEKEGVGHARKLGCDVAVALFARGTIQSDWISTTDGDALVPETYFAGKPADAAGLVFGFRHVPYREEAALYEIFLRYYRLGLQYACSPYAFHTLGSTISFRAEAYAKVRGFPQKDAAEDFYFLNKISKVGRIATGTGTMLLSSRNSSRVPFGTGMSLQNLSKLADKNAYPLYDPDIFEKLKSWLATFDISTANAQLTSLGAKGALATAQTTRTSETDRHRHMRDWFDGFRTLKFVHALRDTDHPSLPFRSALAQASFLNVDPHASLAELAAQMEQLDTAACYLQVPRPRVSPWPSSLPLNS